MVITTSDSTNTLVSLDHYDGLKRVKDSSQSTVPLGFVIQNEAKAFRRTSLYLPVADDAIDNYEENESDYSSDDDDGDDDDCIYGAVDPSFRSPIQPTKAPSTVLYLPQTDADHQSVDECLQHVPSLWEPRDDLLAQSPVQLNESTTKHRVLYVGQGELAHCTPSQVDILVSDRATTCHILALRSTLRSAADSTSPLCTMTHIDGTGYSSCLRSTFAAHREHHISRSSENGDDMIELDIHVIGGFDDSHGSSRDISTWLMHELATLADDFVDTVRCTLRTVCVSAMNHNGINHSPLIRGLGMQCSTGRIFIPAVCDAHVVGPAGTLRAARLWSTTPNQQTSPHQQLYCIHTSTSDEIVLSPFDYKLSSAVQSLLQWSDNELLMSCSTSPHCEEEDFCDTLRNTLQFMTATPSASAFDQDTPLRFRRTRTNVWVRCC